MTRPSLTIRRNFLRPDLSVPETLAGVPTVWVTDILGGEGALDYRIGPLFEVQPVIGTALTAHCSPRDNLAVLAAITCARPGDVVVVATGGYCGSAIAGDIVVGMAKNAGVAAIVTDGAMRDLVGLRRIGLPLFACGLTPNAPRRIGPGSVGEPISVGGRTVHAGDVIIADMDGVVVVPRDHAAEVAAAIPEIRMKETRMEARLAEGMREPDWISSYLQGEETAYLD